MRQETSKQENRKTQILDAVFSIAAEQRAWSLADIAKRVGVSKTALYRHFANRAEIEKAMDERLVAKIAEMAASAQPTLNGIRVAIVTFFRSYPGYLNHLVFRFLSDPSFLGILNGAIRDGNPLIRSYFEEFDALTGEARAEEEIWLQKNWISLLVASYPAEGMEDMMDGLVTTLESGFQRLAVPTDTRLDDLERKSLIEEEKLPTGNRLYQAIASSIQKHGLLKTTIESIAEEMGIAKSSLYFYGKNKTEMLGELVATETKTIIEFCVDGISEGETLAEQIFVLMSIQADYLIKRQDIIPVFNWIRIEAVKEPRMEAPEHPERSELLDRCRTDGLFEGKSDKKVRVGMIMKWASLLSTSCVVRGKVAGLSDAETRKNVRRMFKSMMAGDKDAALPNAVNGA